ncbi:MAG: nitroreductase family protein [Desulfuromonadaceae bacterium]|nr:nitroreductase family protein [Desulfuromonadaceae bacterium]
MQTFESLITNRSTCRNFSDNELQRKEINELITTAIWVPSGSNNHPWHFVVITNRDKLRAYSDAAKTAWLGVPEQYDLVAPVILGHPAQKKSSSRNLNPRKNFAINWF